jgi:hypothetical protein
MESHGIKPIDMGDSTYIHAEDTTTFISSLVSIRVEPDTIEPGSGADYPKAPNIVRQCSVFVEIDDSLAPYTGNAMLRVEEVTFSGGHHYYLRPLNRFPEIYYACSDSLNAWNGRIETVYKDNCKYGGQYRLIAYYQDGSRLRHSEDTLTIRVPGLVALSEDKNYILTGEDTIRHPPHNHFIFKGWTARFDSIVRKFYTNCDTLYPELPEETIIVNDISLIDGGLFDIGPSPQHPQYQLWHTPHTGHRGGFEEDVSFTDFDTTHAYYQILIDVCKEVSGERPWIWEVRWRRKYSGHIHAYFCKLDERKWP